jgi:hypothetical protein
MVHTKVLNGQSHTKICGQRSTQAKKSEDPNTVIYHTFQPGTTSTIFKSFIYHTFQPGTTPTIFKSQISSMAEEHSDSTFSRDSTFSTKSSRERQGELIGDLTRRGIIMDIGEKPSRETMLLNIASHIDSVEEEMSYIFNQVTLRIKDMRRLLQVLVHEENPGFDIVRGLPVASLPPSQFRKRRGSRNSSSMRRPEAIIQSEEGDQKQPPPTKKKRSSPRRK